MNCHNCQRRMSDCQSMRPIDPAGSEDRRWVCNYCDGVTYINQESALLDALAGYQIVKEE